MDHKFDPHFLNIMDSEFIPNILHRYTQEELTILAEKFVGNNQAQPIDSFFIELLRRFSNKGTYEEYKYAIFCPYEKLPLLINHPLDAVQKILKWRLKINK